jgi:hypothetical protein
VLPRKWGAHFLFVSQLTKREIISWALFSINFLIERVPSWHTCILGLWPDRGSKLKSIVFFNISIKFLIERVPSCRIFEFWDFGRIGSRPQAQMIMSPKLKMILTLRPFERAIICSILIEITRVMLVKLYFSW